MAALSLLAAFGVCISHPFRDQKILCHICPTCAHVTPVHLLRRGQFPPLYCLPNLSFALWSMICLLTDLYLLTIGTYVFQWFLHWLLTDCSYIDLMKI